MAAKNSFKRWTKDDDDYLRANEQKKNRVLAKDLARTEASIIWRRCHIAGTLGRGRKLTPSYDRKPGGLSLVGAQNIPRYVIFDCATVSIVDIFFRKDKVNEFLAATENQDIVVYEKSATTVQLG